MHLWSVTEFLRELRFLWPSSDCTGFGLGTTLLLLLLSWISGLATGFFIAALCFSQTCRRLLLFALQGGINVLGPTVPGTLTSRAVQIRSRLGEHRQA